MLEHMDYLFPVALLV